MHFGAPDPASSRKREKHFVRWLDSIADRAARIYLVGDLFDFWFEYGHAVPKGYARMLGKLAELSDAGIEIHVFGGNHDMWYKDYLVDEIGAILHSDVLVETFHGQKCYIAHGDGLGPGDKGYKLLKWLFRRRWSQWMFGLLHPDLGFRLARLVSDLGNHNYGKGDFHNPHYGDEELLYQHAREVLKTQSDIRFFIFGHRHLLRREEMVPGSECIYLGDWIEFYSYFEISPDAADIHTFPISSDVSNTVSQ